MPSEQTSFIHRGDEDTQVRVIRYDRVDGLDPYCAIDLSQWYDGETMPVGHGLSLLRPLAIKLRDQLLSLYPIHEFPAEIGAAPTNGAAPVADLALAAAKAILHAHKNGPIPLAKAINMLQAAVDLAEPAKETAKQS